MPWLSAMICSQTAASSGPCTLSSSSARASLSPSPPIGQLGEPGEDVVADARSRGAHERDPLGEEPAGDEAEDLRGRLVEPLRVVDDADERLLLGDLGEQRQRGEPDQEPVRARAGAQAEHRRERVALRGGQPVEVIEHRRAELMEAAVGQLHLRLDADGRRDAPAGDTVGQVVQQRALADARLARAGRGPGSDRRARRSRSRSSASHSARRPRSLSRRHASTCEDSLCSLILHPGSCRQCSARADGETRGARASPGATQRSRREGLLPDTTGGAMSTTEVRGEHATAACTATVDIKLEVVIIPVSDVDRAKEFYAGLGWSLDADFAVGDGFDRPVHAAGLRLLDRVRQGDDRGRAGLGQGLRPDRLRHRGGPRPSSSAAVST